MKGKLYLIPAPLGENPVSQVIPEFVRQIVDSLEYFFVEEIKTARRYLRRLNISRKIESLEFFSLNEHTNFQEITRVLLPILSEHSVGLISEAGCPSVADPGSDLVRVAHSLDIQVVPLTGPSSIFLSLMSSGMNGQNFAFVGYLPIKKDERIAKIRFLEKRSHSEKQTQIFIETPYRNQQLLADILQTCKDSTYLCVAADLTLETEYIKTLRIGEWKCLTTNFHKRPAVFLIYSDKNF